MSLLTLATGERAVFIPHSGFAKCEPADPQKVELPSLQKLCRIVRIQALVAASYGIEASEMKSDSRKRDVSWPRQVAMYLCRQVFGDPLPKIGREFGHRDHTTVCFAIKQVEKRMAADPVYRADVEALKGALS